MGVFISLRASNKVDPVQWEKAYEETLLLVDWFKLINFQEFEKFGCKYVAAVKCQECQYPSGMGWCTVGEGVYMATAEDFFLPRKIGEPKINEKYCDPLMYIYAQEGDINFENPYVKGLRYLWDSKTQGEPYHIALLAIACLLDDRLNGEVACGSDITYGQCEHAVELANKILKKKIQMPLRCRIDDLYERVRQLPLDTDQMLDAFAIMYLGIKDERYYKFVKEHFSEEEQYLFIKKKMNNYGLGMYGFANDLQEILSYNIPIAKICSVFLEMDVKKKNLVKSDKEAFKYFIEGILDTDIYLPEQDMRDCLKVDESTPETMSVEKLLASVMFMSARNRSVARYIPLEDLKSQFDLAFGDKCDVNGIINNYLKEKLTKLKKEKKDFRTELNDAHDAFNNKIDAKKEKYDIIVSNHIIFYKTGKSFSPEILKVIESGMEFFGDLLKEPTFAELSQKDYKEQCRFLETHNRSLKLMNSVWLNIFDNIENDPTCFKRYYPMVRIKITNDTIHNFVRAYVENDDFYDFCQTLALEK